MSNRAELRNPHYRNWVRAAIGLKYLQQGLAGFVSNLSAQRHQTHLYSFRKVTGAPAHSCTECTADNLLPEHPRKTCIQKYRSKCFCNSPAGRRICPNNFCSRFYDLIVLDHDERNPVWTNTDPSSWYDEHWSFARCFLSTAGYYDKHSAGETDAAGLLSILINNVEFRASLDKISDFEEVKNTRNDIVHSATFEIEEDMLKKVLDQFIAVLKDKKSLIYDADAQQAVNKLEKLKTDEIHISSVEAEELHKKALKAIAEKKDGALAEIERKTFDSIERIREAKKQEIKVVCNAITQTLTDVKTTQTVDVTNTVSNLEKRELQRYLIDLYRTGYMKTDLSPLTQEEIDVDKVYVPLKMLKRIGNKTDSTSLRTLSDIFFCGNKRAKCIYVSGDAGIGKTTLCRKIISDWCYVHSFQSDHIPIPEDKENDLKKTNTQSVYVNETQDLNNADNSLISEDIPIRSKSDSDDENNFMFESEDNLSDMDYSSEASESSINTFSKDTKGLVEHEEDDYEELAIKQYNYLFFISLRDTYKERSIEEMVHSQLLRKQKLQETFRLVLDEEAEKCLFILDGLDEWVPPFPLPTHPTVTRGLPVSSGEGRFTKLFTSRPWKIELLRPNLDVHDLDISIQGIEESSLERLVRNVFEEMTSNHDEVELNTVIFLHKLKEMNLDCLGSVPLLLKLLVCLFQRDGELADTLVAIYSSIISKLCSLAIRRNENNDVFKSLLSQVAMQNCELPSCLQKYPVCCGLSSVINSLGRLSFKTLLHDNREAALVFNDEDLTLHGISKTESELSLLTGLLSKKKVIASSKLYPVRCVSFIHKTFQEYFAALYIAMTFEQNSTVQEKLRESCSTSENSYKVLDMLFFIKEIDPAIICRVTSEINVDEKQCKLSINKNQLVLITTMNSHIKGFLDLLMSDEIISIIVNSSNLGIYSLRFPLTMANLNVIEFNCVEMTNSAFRDIMENIPETSGGLSLTFCNVAFKQESGRTEECQIRMKCRSLRLLEISFMNICGVKLSFSEMLKYLECAKFYMVTIAEKELVDLLESVPDLDHDVAVMFNDITLKSTSYQNSEKLIQILNIKDFPCEAKHLRSFTIQRSDHSILCQKIIFDEDAGKNDPLLWDLESKLKTDNARTMFHVMSTKDTKNFDMIGCIPEFEVVRFGCKMQNVHVLHLSNIVVMQESLFDILSDSKFDQLSLLQLDNIVLRQPPSVSRCLSLKCDTLRLRQMQMCNMLIWLSRPTSSVSLVEVTLTVEGIRMLLDSTQDTLNSGRMKIELENVSLSERLSTRHTLNMPVQCGHIGKLSNKRENHPTPLIYLKHVTMAKDDFCLITRTIVQSENIHTLELENIVIKDNSIFQIVQGLPISHTILELIFLNMPVELCLRDISLTDKAFQFLVEYNTDQREDKNKALILDRINISPTSFSDKREELSNGNVWKHITIERTNLMDKWITFRELQTLRMEDVTLTENAFCFLLQSHRKVRLIMLDKITITNTSATEKEVSYGCSVNLTIKRTYLANLMIRFPLRPLAVHFEHCTMTENAFIAFLESLTSRSDKNYISVMLDNISLTKTSTKCRKISVKCVDSLTINSMCFSSLVISFDLKDCRHFSKILMKDIAIEESSLQEMLDSLPTHIFDVNLDLHDDSSASSRGNREHKTIRQMSVAFKTKKGHFRKSDFPIH